MVSQTETLKHEVGLCADCRYAMQIASSHGSVFYRCEYAAVDASFPKYPRLPVLTCVAYRSATNDPQK